MKVSTNTSNSSQNIGSSSQSNVANNSHILDLGKQLLEACRSGDITEVKVLVDNGAPFTTDWLGTSPLHLASQYGHNETAEYLLRAGASKDTRTKVDRTPLHVAALEGHLSIVSLLLTNGAEIDARDLLKMTPLHWATERGHYDVVEFLLAHGSDVNLQSKFDKTAIDIAIEAGHNEMIPLLKSYVNAIRPKTNQNSPSTNLKTRPTILPNKSNRTQRTSKYNTSNSSINLNEPLIISSSNGKNINIENIKKLICNSNLIKKDNSVSSSSFNGSNTTTINACNVKEAMQWLEINSIAPSNGKKTDEDNTLQRNNSQVLSITDISKISANKLPNNNKNKIITIVTNNQIPHLIKNSPHFVVLKGKNEVEDKIKKKIKFEKMSPTISNKFINTNQNLNKQIQTVKIDLNSGDIEKLKNENEKLKEENEKWKEKYEKLQNEVEKLRDDFEKSKSRK